MTLFNHFPRFRRIVFVMALVGLLTTFAAIIFVSAENNGSTPVSTDSVAPDTADKARIAERFGQLPLSFERNEGQIDPAVKFLSHGSGYDLFLTANEAVLSLRKPAKLKSDTLKSDTPGAEVREGSVLRLKMIGANAAAQV